MTPNPKKTKCCQSCRVEDKKWKEDISCWDKSCKCHSPKGQEGEVLSLAKTNSSPSYFTGTLTTEVKFNLWQRIVILFIPKVTLRFSYAKINFISNEKKELKL